MTLNSEELKRKRSFSTQSAKSGPSLASEQGTSHRALGTSVIGSAPLANRRVWMTRFKSVRLLCRDRTSPSAHMPIEIKYEKWSTPDEEKTFRLERKRLSENHFNRGYTLSAWLLATLVGVNGVAANAMVAKATQFSSDGRVLAPMFVSGVVFAIIAGFASAQEAQDRSGMYYLESLLPGQRSREGVAKENLWRTRAFALNVIARFANYLSLLVFILGVVWACWAYSGPSLD